MDNRVYLDEVSDILRTDVNRRQFMKRLVVGSAGAAFSGLVTVSNSSASVRKNSKSVVSLVTGNDRRDMVYQALKPLKKEIEEGIKDKQVIIKPNLVGSETFLGIAHPDAVRGVLDFLKPIYKQPVLIAESTGRRYRDHPGTIKHFHLYRYFPLLEEYNVRLVDLNARPYSVEWVLGAQGHPLDIRIISDFLDPNNYFISLCRLKAHNALVVTLSTKNMLFAAPLTDATRSDKGRLHSPGIRKMNFDVFLLAQKVQPRLAVIDGLEGMEGNGPMNGTPVNHGVALASTDFIAADSVGCILMGVKFSDVGYLTFCSNAGIGQGDISKIEIIGPDPATLVKPYRMHDNFWGDKDHEGQLNWKD